MLEPDRSRYANYSGTGNSLNADHPAVRRLILDSFNDHFMKTIDIGSRRIAPM